ncbi:MAG: hypothetical protein AAGE13_05885 [Pseudomonadota bacterium]
MAIPARRLRHWPHDLTCLRDVAPTGEAAMRSRSARHFSITSLAVSARSQAKPSANNTVGGARDHMHRWEGLSDQYVAFEYVAFEYVAFASAHPVPPNHATASFAKDRGH